MTSRTQQDKAAVLDVMSDVSVESEEDEVIHVMDPSDPRAHGRQNLTSTAKSGSKAPAQSSSRWDQDSDDERNDAIIIDDSGEDEDDVDEDLGVVVHMDNEQETTENASDPSLATDSKAKAPKLSNWAMSRFLVSRKDRKIPVVEEPPLEPLNDFILSDFGTRFRGPTGEVVVEKDVEASDGDDGDDGDAKFRVGAPLFDSSPSDEVAGSEKAAKEAKNDENGKASQARKRRENRYFVTDLATKCFNCGQVGHMSNVCANDKLQKPCYYCGLRGHNTFVCPHLPCTSCLQLGHEVRDCNNRRLTRRSCAVCGRAGHDKENCGNVDLRNVTCMVCLKGGHLHCAPIPPPADRRIYCPHCAGNHELERCRDYVEPSPVSFTVRPVRADMKCFICNKPGHIAAACPTRTGYNGGNSCFNCGERGHYASDCPNSGSRGGRGQVSGRKRGRREFYDDDEDEDRGARRGGNGNHGYGGGSNRRVFFDNSDEDENDNGHYYVPGSRASNSYPRLDAALPSFRGFNGNRHGQKKSYGGNRRQWR
ncbi:hypothetical protein Poli38472_011347 [Pythium oligandrum]|uniref:CCHC-type domain-containing protein n=1 Tax=Pythium oligandrum TaxID=41045 RepID=A0A8K1CLF6_PYTOL|nr:hypothetical protein Poli38472_011347 [Pythium oligandrum]|eukprot:TMW64467.1 hypothetical protein Poli38472_011347 [Pythium oligandrum]